MDKEYQDFEELFALLLEADQKIWEAVLKIQDSNNELTNAFIKPLMGLRGELHTEFMRPIYKKYPEIAKKAGFDKEST